MSKTVARTLAVALPLAMMSAMAMTSPAVAASPGTDISASSPGPCEVTFQIVNRTNSTSYTIDFRVDGEPLTGPNYGSGPTGRLSVHSEVAPGTPIFQPGVVGYRNDLPPFTSSKTENLHTLGYPDKLPTETYNVEYRMILGPNSPDRHPNFQSIQVPGCALPGLSTGSAQGSNSLIG